MPQSQLAQPSLHLPQLSYFFFKKLGLLYFLQFFVFYSCISTDSDVYDLSLLCPLINEDDFRGFYIPSHYTFKSHRTLKPVFRSYHLLWGMFVSRIYPFQLCPHSCQCTYRATLLCRLLYSRWATLLHSLVRWLTLFSFSSHILHMGDSDAELKNPQGRSQDFSKRGSQRLLTRLSCRPPRRAPLLSLVYQRAQSYNRGMKAHIK